MKALFAAILLFAVPAFADKLDDEAMGLAKQLNSQCPIMSDKVTRTDAVFYMHVGSERIFTYNQTIVVANKDNNDKLKTLIKQNTAKEQARRCATTEEAVKAGWSYQWIMKSPDGTQLGVWKISPSICK